tara:strand:+ start:578 stop:1312 length:735 start_codon:yes stop_codon:yes gene_type:complete
MQYNVQYNQKALIEYNERNKGNEIDIYDAIIINSIDAIIQNWSNLQSMNFGKNVYYWIAYDKLLNELPSLNISTKNGLAKRLKRKLIDNDLLKRFIVKDDNSKTFFRITDKGSLLLVRYKGVPNGIDTDERENPTRTTVTKGTDDRQTNNNTNYNITEDKRELSHFEFLKMQDPKQFNKLKKEPVSDWDYLKRKFDNKFKSSKKRPTIIDLENYILSWLQNDGRNKNNTNSIIETKPPYLRKIT